MQNISGTVVWGLNNTIPIGARIVSLRFTPVHQGPIDVITDQNSKRVGFVLEEQLNALTGLDGDFDVEMDYDAKAVMPVNNETLVVTINAPSGEVLGTFSTTVTMSALASMAVEGKAAWALKLGYNSTAAAPAP